MQNDAETLDSNQPATGSFPGMYKLYSFADPSKVLGMRTDEGVRYVVLVSDFNDWRDNWRIEHVTDKGYVVRQGADSLYMNLMDDGRVHCVSASSLDSNFWDFKSLAGGDVYHIQNLRWPSKFLSIPFPHLPGTEPRIVGESYNAPNHMWHKFRVVRV
jgi:hypothetical protein